jgi:hypothetical protein
MQESDSSITLFLASFEPELCEWLYSDLGVDESTSFPSAHFSGKHVSFLKANTVEEIPEQSSADILVALVRFVDVLSLKALDELLHAVQGSRELPTAVLIYRNEGETDFKMSCPYCGQKLWVRDADEDKRGRCPHCKKGFTLPNQKEHVRSVLRLKRAVPVHLISRNDTGSLAGPFKTILKLRESSVLESLEIGSTFHNNQTMNVDVEIEDDE